ncbi:putative disease resistance RPP13-like protein 1, partial [Mucuna pruriens]
PNVRLKLNRNLKPQTRISCKPKGCTSIRDLQNILNPWDALIADLRNKTQLYVFENLQPSKYLKDLSIRYYGGTQFPNWLFDNSLSNVVFLRLEHCKYCLLLPPLGILLFLKDLTIKGG